MQSNYSFKIVFLIFLSMQKF